MERRGGEIQQNVQGRQKLDDQLTTAAAVAGSLPDLGGRQLRLAHGPAAIGDAVEEGAAVGLNPATQL